MAEESNMGRGAWRVYKPGYLALYSIGSVVMVLLIVSAWSAGNVVFRGLIGILFVTMAGRQLYLKGQQTRSEE
jgi:hypothetical protein